MHRLFSKLLSACLGFLLVSGFLVSPISAQIVGETEWGNWEHFFPPELSAQAVHWTPEAVWVGGRFGLAEVSAATDVVTYYTPLNSSLPGYDVRAFAEGVEGGIWIATNQGLARLHNADWTVFTPENSPLPSADVRDVIVSKEGTVWSGTAHGVARYDAGNWTIFDTGNAELTHNGITALGIDALGHLWVGQYGTSGSYSSGWLSWFDGTTWKKAEGGSPVRFLEFEVDPNGDMWSGSEWVLARWKNRSVVESYNNYFGDFGEYISDVDFDAEGRLWVATTHGVFRRGEDDWIRYAEEEGLNLNGTRGLAFDPDGVLWIANTSAGLSRLEDGTFEVLQMTNQPDMHTRRRLAGGGGNGTWMTADQGLLHRSGKEWTYIPPPDSISPLADVAVGPDGRVWVVNSTDGLMMYDGTVWSRFKSPVYSNKYTRVVEVDVDGTVWLGPQSYWDQGEGLVRFDGSNWTLYTTDNSPLPYNDVDEIVADPEGGVWICTDLGLAHLEGEAWTVYTTENSGIPSNVVETVARDQKGRLWVGTDRGLASLSGTTWTHYSAYDLGFMDVYANNATSIFVDDRGIVWVGTLRGVAALMDGMWKSFLTSEHPFPGIANFEIVQQLEVDQDGRLWINLGHRGIFILNPKDIPPSPDYEVLPPSRVMAFPKSNEVELRWSHSKSENVSYYNIYRDRSPIDSRLSPSTLLPYHSTQGASTSYVDTDLQTGWTYYYRITAVNAEVDESSLFSDQAYAFLYPESVSVEATQSFGSAAEAEDYRLVALPGQVDRPLSNVVGGKAGVEWQAFRENGKEVNFLQKYDGSELFNFRPGSGIWLTHKQGWTVDTEIPTVKLRGDTIAVIDLHDGWNIVSNPTGKDIPWNLVAAENGNRVQSLWHFNRSFTQVDTFRSAREGVGYYFYNELGLDSLAVPYTGSPVENVGTRKAEEMNGVQSFSLEASVRFDGTSPVQMTSQVRLGVAPTAKDGKGPFDVFAPPSNFSRVSLQLRAPRAKEKEVLHPREGYWAQDIRSSNTDGQLYDLVLRGEPHTTVHLLAKGLEELSGRKAVLLDPSQGKRYELRPDGIVELVLRGEGTRSLRVALGGEEYLRSQEETVIPKEITLTSYPNPIRSQGILAYTLPSSSEVQLVIYDALGRQVALLENGRKEAGRHRVRLGATGLSSGLYFGHLRAAGRSLTQKIAVAR